MSIAAIRLGLEIIEKHCPHDDPQFDHDVIYAGIDSRDKMTGLEKDQLEKLGWRWDEKYNCWRHF